MDVNQDIKTELESQLKSCEDEFMAHACMIRTLIRTGYEEGHHLIEVSLHDNAPVLSNEIKERIKDRITNHHRFEKHKEKLRSIMTSDNWKALLMQWANDTRKSGLSDNEIYDILIELSLYIQHDPETREKDSLHDEFPGVLNNFLFGENKEKPSL